MARFRRYGRSRQLVIASGEDLTTALALDSARWAATGAPVDGIMIDAALLRYLDGDGDGRILAHEVRAAISWSLATFSDLRGISTCSDTLKVGDLAQNGPDYDRLVGSLDRLRARLGKAPDASVSLQELRAYANERQTRPVNVAGIVLPEAAPDESLRSFIDDAIRATGGTQHPSGELGLQLDQSDAFVSGIDSFLAWRDRQPAPFGADTPALAELVRMLTAKIDQYFRLSAILLMNEDLARSLWRTDEELLRGEMLDEASKLDDVLERYPVARPRNDGTLLLAEVNNPLYSVPLARLFKEVVAPKWPQSPKQLNEAIWTEIKAGADGYASWESERPQMLYDAVDPAALQRYRSGEEISALTDLVKSTEEEEITPDEIAIIEKAILYQANILRFVNSFVSFPHLYDSSSRALFEVGSLVMDGRYFHLAVRVDDRAAHKNVARTSNMYVLYVIVRGPGQNPRYEVAVPVTSGRVGNLAPGKRGVFVDLEGSEYDAEVAEIIDNPVSLGEAIRAPFRRLGNALTTRIQTMGSDAEKKVSTFSPSGLFGSSNTAGLIAGGGVAVAAMGSAAAFITGILAKLAWWKILIALGALIAAIAIPALVVAATKLRNRDMSAILEGSGWAVNSRMQLTRRLSRFFTQQPGRRYRVPAILRSRPDQ